MNITKDVIIDLLPLYLADEVSEDTRQLVEEFLVDDPQLAKLARSVEDVKLPAFVPTPDLKEPQLKALKKAQNLRTQKSIAFGVAVFFTALFIAFRSGDSGVEWVWQNNATGGWLMFTMATIGWLGYGNVIYMLRLAEK